MSERQILHIAQDEKFINAAYALFEDAFPGANHFVIIQPPADPPIRYLDEAVKENSEIIVRSSGTKAQLEKMSRKHSVTVFHGVDNLKGAIFLDSPQKDRFMSIVYGAEIYNSKMMGDEVVGEKTKELYASSNKDSPLEIVKDLYRKVKYRDIQDYEYVDTREVLYGMNALGSLPSFSYERLISEGIYNSDVKKVPFSYYPLEFIIKEENLRVCGRDVLLGNSASETNNHIEALDLLKESNFNCNNIYTPLSYGQKKYAELIISYGNDLFPERFKPLTTFLPLEEYNKILSKCGIVIMNHYRPQAMGNIIASLYMGAKVLLNDTDAYRYFRELGCHIYLIEDVFSTEEETMFDLLTDQQISHNRRVLEKELSKSNLVEKMRTSFKKIFDFPNTSLRVVG